MAIDFLAVASLGFLSTPGVAPTAPTITSVDNTDGTGVVVTLSGEDSASTNELFMMLGTGPWVSKGTSWPGNDMSVSLANGVYWGYVKSTIGSMSSFSLIIRIPSTDITGAATDNNPTGVATMKGKAVYWPVADTPDQYGRPVIQDPVEIDVRWDDDQVEFVDEEGTVQMSKAQCIVDRDLEIGGILFKGELTDVTDFVDPKNNINAHEIRQILNTPDFVGTTFLREAYM